MFSGVFGKHFVETSENCDLCIHNMFFASAENRYNRIVDIYGIGKVVYRGKFVSPVDCQTVVFFSIHRSWYAQTIEQLIDNEK